MARISDRCSAVTDRNAIHAPTALGKSRSITPEGFLVCHDVAIGRIGVQLYKASEVLELEADAWGNVRVERDAKEVFSAESMSSYEGKPVTVEHPNQFVTPDNWKQVAVGVAVNVHRGKGIEDDLLLADLIIKDADAIAYVNNEMPEISCGYDAGYEQTSVGHGRQINIVGNHVALVDRGRAGPRCSIKDEEAPMSKSVIERIKRLTAALAGDPAKVQDALVVDDESDFEDAKAMKDSMDAIAKELKEIRDWKAGKEKEEKEMKDAKDAKDAADALLVAENAGKVVNLGKTYTGDALQDVVSAAEILSPGIKLPTNDAADFDAVTALARMALEKTDPKNVEPFLMKRDLKTLTGDSLMGVFRGAAAFAALRNNNAAVVLAASKNSPTKDTSGSMESQIEAINAANKKAYFR